MVAAINGHNGHNGHTHALSAIKLPSDDEPPPKPCALRLGHGSWCFLPDGHEGEHEGAPPQYGPVEERPSLWRQRTKGMIK